MLIACALGTVSCASKKVANQQPYPNYAGQSQPQPYYGQPQQPYYGQPQQPYYGQPQQPYYGQPQQPYYGQPQQAPQNPQTDMDGFVEKQESPIQAEATNPPYGEIRGYGQAVTPNEQAAISRAKGIARGDIQAQVETFVKYALDIYNQTTTVGDSQQFDQTDRENIINLARGAVQAVVVKSRVLYNKQTKQYKVEVCSKFDKAGVINALEEQSQRILKNREKFIEDMQGVWDEYDRMKGRKTQAELENEENLRIEASKNAMEQENLDRQNAREIDKINTYGQNIANIEAQKQAANAPAIYYYSVNGTQYGPVNIHQLGGLAKNGQITIYTSIWREGLAAWTPAGQLPELRTIFASAPGSIPPPPPAY